MGFDLPQRQIEIREIDVRYREPLRRYLTELHSVVQREQDGIVLAPKLVIETMIQSLAEALVEYRPFLSLSQKRLRLVSSSGRTEVVLHWQSDRNNRAGQYVGASLLIEMREALSGNGKPPRLIEFRDNLQMRVMTQNLNCGFAYELSRY